METSVANLVITYSQFDQTKCKVDVQNKCDTTSNWKIQTLCCYFIMYRAINYTNQKLSIFFCDLQKKLLVIYFIKYSRQKQPQLRSRGVLWKKVFLEISLISQENTCARVSFLIKLQTSSLQLIKKETPAQVFSHEFSEVSKNTFFTENLWRTAVKNTRLHLFSKLLYTEADQQPCQTSKMKVFAKIVNVFQPLTIFAKTFILNVWQGSEHTSGIWT